MHFLKLWSRIIIHKNNNAFISLQKEKRGNASYSKVPTDVYPPRHLLNLHLTAYHTASLRDRRGRCARTPSGSCARFYYITRGVSDAWGGGKCIFYKKFTIPFQCCVEIALLTTGGRGVVEFSGYFRVTRISPTFLT